MRHVTVGILVGLALLLAGCGGGTMDINENGTYDVKGYDKVVVHVGESDAGEGSLASQPDVSEQDLDLVRVQFKRFSMEVPSVMVEDYTAAELADNDLVTLSVHDDDSGQVSQVYIRAFETGGYSTLEDFSLGAPIEDVNGMEMAVTHEHVGDQRRVAVEFMHDDVHYSVSLSYPVAWDELYSEYSEQFYRTIQMN